jgi:hypothetical protein
MEPEEEIHNKNTNSSHSKFQKWRHPNNKRMCLKHGHLLLESLKNRNSSQVNSKQSNPRQQHHQTGSATIGTQENKKKKWMAQGKKRYIEIKGICGFV